VIPIKTKGEINKMKEGGKITAGVLKKVLQEVKPGVNLEKLDNLAEELLIKSQAEPSFKTVEGYEYSTCINTNSGVVHGIPKQDVVIEEGDLVSVDLGAYYKGFHTDSGWTVLVGNRPPVRAHGSDEQTLPLTGQGDAYKQKMKFLKVGEKALGKAIEQCRVGNTVGDISYTIQSVVEKAGYTVVRDLIGHGVGKELHEPPQVPGFGRKGIGPKLLEGMVLAIEVIYTMGSREIVCSSDGWTIETKDGSFAGLFERTVAVVEGFPLVLTV